MSHRDGAMSDTEDSERPVTPPRSPTPPLHVLDVPPTSAAYASGSASTSAMEMTSTSASTSDFSIASTPIYTLDYTIPPTSGSTPEFGIVSTPTYTLDYTMPPTSGSTPEFGIVSTPTYTLDYTMPSTSKSTLDYSIPSTSKSTLDYSIPSTSKSTLDYSIPSTSKYTPEYAIPSTSKYTPEYAIPSTSKSTLDYSIPSTSKYTSDYAMPSTSKYTSDYAMPSTSKSTSDYAMPSTSKSTSDYAIPSTSKSTSDYAMPSTSKSTLDYAMPSTSKSTSDYAMPSTSKSTSDYAMPSTSKSTSDYAMPSTSKSTSDYAMPSTSKSTSTASRHVSKKIKSWDPTTDYEIERIVGYHRDEHEQMWYFVKWKGWPEEYNTYEPIENMTGCNYLLMKYFEFRKPTERVFSKKDNEILASLNNYEPYQKLLENNFRKEDLDEFSETCLDISKMFKKGSFQSFSRTIQKEYEYIIRCLIGMCSHQDPGLVRRAQNYKIALKMIKMRRKQLRENLAAQNHISAMENIEVKVENYNDFDTFPKELTYVVDLVPGENVVLPNDPTVGCECENGCTPKSHCCGEMASTLFAYNRYRRVRSLERFAIYECNRRCKCPPSCINRVVQHGMKVKLCIFKTESYGWGVKALERIPKGTFICEYVGELISDAQAVVRDIEYYKKNSSYVFDLDFSPDHDTNMYCIDATKIGNLSRFINHSCNPNLVVYPVWIDCLEPNLHRLAFFARRTIMKNEEICIDYENAQDGRVPQLSKEEQEKKQRTLRTLCRIRCQCGAAKCREWVFGN